MLFEYIRQAYTSILSNKKTSVLTMIGIVIGLCAVITIITIGDTLSGFLKDYISQAESGNSITVEIYDRDKKYYFTEDEIANMSESLPPCVSGIVRETFSISGRSIVDEQHYSESSIIGVSPEYLLYKNLKIINGKFIDDSVADKPVAVISDIAAECLFGNKNAALGEKIQATIINPITSEPDYLELYVIGIYQYNDTNGIINASPDKRTILFNVYTPYKFVNNHFNIVNDRFDTLIFQAVNHDGLDAMYSYLYKYMDMRFVGEDGRYSYGLSDRNDTEGTDDIAMIVKVVTIVFIMIACISLVVGGIGLMNTMLISVTRRTKEIGIRKALGAKNSAIRIQFIVEAVLISLVSCVIGVLLSLITSKIIEANIGSLMDMLTNGNTELQQFASNFPLHFVPSWSGIIKTSLFSIAVGTIFGYYPANKGAKMQPVDALRFE